MDKVTIENIVEYLKEKLNMSGIIPYKIIVYGSASSGKLTVDSDIDIAIISDHFRNVDIFERSLLTINAERETMRKFGIPIDVVRLTVSEYEKNERMIAYYIKTGSGLH